MSFHIQVNNISAYNITSHLIKKPEKDLGFNDVGKGNLENHVYLNLQYSLLCPCVLLLKGINVYYHT